MALTKITGQVINTATDVTVGVLTVTNTLAVGGTVSIGGTLTYEDVTNVDAIGIITARSNILVGSGITLSPDGHIFTTGISTHTGEVKLQNHLRLVDNKNIYLGTGADLEIRSGGNDGVINQANADLKIQRGGSGKVTFKSTGSHFIDDVFVVDKIAHDGDSNTAIRFPADDTFTVETSGSERLRITSAGKVGISTASPDARLHILASNESGILLEDSGIANNAPYLEIMAKRTDDNVHQSFSGQVFLARNRTEQKISSGLKLGTILFGGNHTDGSKSNILYAASIAGMSSDDFDSASDMPTDLVFFTGSTGRAPAVSNVSSGTERLRITSSGHLGLNITPGSWDSVPTFVALEGGGNSKHGSLHFQANGDWTTSLGCNHYYNGGWKYRHNGGASWLAMKEDELAFRLASSGSADGAISWDDKLTIDSSGNLRIPNDNAQLLIGASADLQLYHDTTGTAGTVIKNTTGHLYVQSIGDVKLRTVDSEMAVDCQANGAVHLHYDGASDSNLYTRYDGLTIRNNNTESTKDCNVDMIGRLEGSAQLHMYADDNTDNNKKFQIKASNGETMDFNSYYTGGWDFHLRFSKGANSTSDRKVQVGKGGIRFDLSAEDYRDIDGDGHLFRRDGQAQLGVDDFFYIHDISTSENNQRLRIKFDSNAGSGSPSITAEGSFSPNTAMDFAEYFEWSDGNPSNEDRIGHTVSVDGLTGKIKIAEEGETVIGVISGTAGFIAGSASFSWQGRFKRDEWGREVYEEQKDENGNLIYADAETRAQIVKTERIETSEYDSSLENSYVPRDLRKEWDIVGLLGQVRVRKTAVIPSNWIKLKEIDSVKDLYLVR